MAKAVGDPAQIRRFAYELKKFNADVTAQIQAMNSKMGSLSGSWRDQEQAKFEEEYETSMKSLLRFLKVSESHVPFLLRKAQRLDDYLQQR